LHSRSERVSGKRLGSEEKESKKSLKEVRLLEINFLLLHSPSERVKGKRMREKRKKKIKKRV
jgi:hypothetical protein